MVLTNGIILLREVQAYFLLCDMGITSCSVQENHQESVLLDGGCWTRRLREYMEVREKTVESKYQGGKEVEKSAMGSPTEYRDWEAIAQTICMNWAVGEKRKENQGRFKRKM